MRGIRQLALCVGVAAAAACGDAELEPLGELVFDRAGEGATQSDSVIVLFGVIADQDFPDSLIEFRVTSTDSGRVIVLGAENAGAAWVAGACQERTSPTSRAGRLGPSRCTWTGYGS